MAAERDSPNLEQSVRQVAYGRSRGAAIDVRRAVRELALGALRSHVLSVRQVARVAQAIAHGLEPAGAQKSSAQAVEGLADALEKALQALAVAAREFAGLGGRLTAGESRMALADLEAIEALIRKSVPPRPPREALATHAGTLRQHLEAIAADDAAEGDPILGLLSSGVLLGLLEAASGKDQPVVRTAAPSKAP